MFVPSGKIVAQSSNNLGLWHDGMIAENGGIYNVMYILLQGEKCVVDTSFNQKQCQFYKLLGAGFFLYATYCI